MTVAELIEKLKDFTNDEEIVNLDEIMKEENTDFNKGVIFGMSIMALTCFNSNKKQVFNDVLTTEKNRYSNISGDYQKYIRGNVFTENKCVNHDIYKDA